ncbi:MAG: 2-hydroxymuconic semialdehyde dehydrogenase [Candidatus Fraserbacteria bacterium RBG_16_55_9]|uniref:2-hydroxymuconic semialdehyde dehydrogenase n=1 Tax=Fraserbacteria sp. (strain RBG_16_55_9) TaxID=1817864 RepID=A0A1F5V0D4_FRAXR|nr:MAG: 2-hydroxymuconic semialdehyde dehydrogenase [Candidatus Fraserbacteria bacterium RBG_16_55_9]
MEHLKNYINGELVEPISRRYLDNYEPATGRVYSYVPDSDERDVEFAVSAAEKAFPAWSVTPAQERARFLLHIADLITQNLDFLAHAESIDSGKPLSLAKSMDIPRAASNFSFFASAILHFASEAHTMEDTVLNYTLRKPIGIAGCISPWNLPLYLFTWKIAPALAAGNCVIGKPSEITPMTAYLFSKLCQEADLPAGVLSIVHGVGSKAGAAISRHPKIGAISFTGGTKTGSEIARVAAPLFKKLSLELGGKNPVLIFADCDYSTMLETTVRSAFTNQGQICLCGSRVFIQRSLYEKFKADFVARAKKLNVGDPLLEGVDQGALISQAHKAKILSYIELAKQEGGRILCGGGEVKLSGRCQDGSFIAPTVIEGPSYDCRTNQEEIFGPVVTIMPFDTEEEVLQYANSTPYGLASILWTGDLTRAHRVANQLQSGIVWVNCWMVRDLRTPFGGMKQSGIGR